MYATLMAHPYYFDVTTIDNMEIGWYFEVLHFEMQEEENQKKFSKKKPTAYIDQVL